MNNEKKTIDKKNKKERKKTDLIVMLILIALVIIMIIFTITRKSANQRIMLMEIYKSSGPSTSKSSPYFYYIYENTNTIEIHSSTHDLSTGNSTNSSSEKELDQNLLNSLKNSLEEYIENRPTINADLNLNEKYIIEYNGNTIVVPNPEVARELGYDETQFIFYNVVENFINTVSNQ